MATEVEIDVGEIDGINSWNSPRVPQSEMYKLVVLLTFRHSACECNRNHHEILGPDMAFCWTTHADCDKSLIGKNIHLNFSAELQSEVRGVGNRGSKDRDIRRPAEVATTSA